VRLETDHRLSSRPLKLLQGAFVCRNFWQQAVVLVADMLIKRLGPLFVDQARKLLQTHRLANLHWLPGEASLTP
jgi:hypothetical protein